MPGVRGVFAELNREQRIPMALDLAGDGASRAKSGRAFQRRGHADSAEVRHVARAALMPDCWMTCSNAKRQSLRSDGLIEMVRRDTSFDDVAGLEAFARLDRKTEERVDSGRAAIRARAAERDFDYGRAGMREEPRRASRGGRVGI